MASKEYAGKTFEIRSLTRKEVKELRKSGLSKTDLTPEEQSNLTDKIVSIVLGDEMAVIAEELPNAEYVKIFIDIMGLTFGTEASEKNSQTSGAGEKPQEKA